MRGRAEVTSVIWSVVTMSVMVIGVISTMNMRGLKESNAIGEHDAENERQTQFNSIMRVKL